MLKFTPRRRLIGGLRLPAHKAASTATAIRRDVVPSRLIVSTRQHNGPPAEPVVRPGQVVLGSDVLARADSPYAANVHAPTSGRVTAIVSGPAPLYAQVATETCIVIEPDGLDRRRDAPGPVALAADRVARLQQIADAGIVGLGGAVYPTAAKLAPEQAVELLIINGAECEPYISCDDMLMRESPEAVLRGAAILRDIVGAAHCVVAIERDKPQAIEAMTVAAERLADERLSIAELPSIYPAGGERQLVEVLTGREVPTGRYPGEFGCLCHNVGTAYAVDRYFGTGEPLTSRVVTVTGSAVAEPRNVETMIGTPIADLVHACGGYVGTPARLIHGGSMMGFTLTSDALPVTKATNCIIVASAAEVRAAEPEWPCIRCGECSVRCPARLLPQDLLLAARAADASALDRLALDECIECGCCDIVCPSHIPLTQTFRRAKPLLQVQRDQHAFSEAANARFHSREKRREELRQTETEQLNEVRQTLSHDDERGRTISAAVARARQNRKRVPTDVI